MQLEEKERERERPAMAGPVRCPVCVTSDKLAL